MKIKDTPKKKKREWWEPKEPKQFNRLPQLNKALSRGIRKSEFIFMCERAQERWQEKGFTIWDLLARKLA